MASFGHNHAISSDSVTGIIYVGESFSDAWFDLRLPVASLVIDDRDIRDRYGEDFADPVPEDAISGTKANMLSDKVLNAEVWPEVSVQGRSIRCAAGLCELALAIELKGQVSRHTVQVELEQHADRIIAHSEFELQQSDLGLKPFSVMMGALSVAEAMQFELDLVATKVVPDDDDSG